LGSLLFNGTKTPDLPLNLADIVDHIKKLKTELRANTQNRDPRKPPPDFYKIQTINLELTKAGLSLREALNAISDQDLVALAQSLAKNVDATSDRHATLPAPPEVDQGAGSRRPSLILQASLLPPPSGMEKRDPALQVKTADAAILNPVPQAAP
jgi:hypothetical protein